MKPLTKSFSICSYLLAVCGLAFAAPLEKEWFVHITPATSPYATEIILNNDSNNEGFIELGYPGSRAPYKIDLMPRETKILRADTLPFYPVSSLQVDKKSAGLDVSLRYVSSDLEAPLLVPTTRESANMFRFQYPRNRNDWQGTALVNVGNQASSIRIVQYDETKTTLFETTLVESLEPGEKYVGLISSLPFVKEPNSFFELLTSEPSAILMLSGGTTQNGKAYLDANQPISSSENHLRIIRTGGIAGITFQVRMTGEQICKQNRIPGNSEVFCSTLGASSRSEILNLIETQNIIELALVLEGKPDTACSDQFFYEVDLSWDGKKNSFAYDECQVDQLTNGAIANDFVLYMISLANSLTENGNDL